MLFIGTNPADIELEIGRLGDLLGDGRTPEAADLVVTPERVESAIYNLADDSDALIDVRTSLDVYSQEEVDTLIGDAGDTSTLSTAGFQWDSDSETNPTRLTLQESASPNHEVFRLERVGSGSDITWNLIVSGNVTAG